MAQRIMASVLTRSSRAPRSWGAEAQARRGGGVIGGGGEEGRGRGRTPALRVSSP